jgi:ribosome-associated protein
VRQGKSLEGLLPQKIIDYIVANDLYLAKIKKQTTILKLLDKAAQTIFDKKGFNILALDVSDVSSMTDYFLIAEGNVDRHVIALGDELRYVLKKEGERPFHVEGDQSGDWLVMNYGDFVIHLFQSEMREKYALEELWHDAKVVDLNIDVSHE